LGSFAEVDLAVAREFHGVNCGISRERIQRAPVRDGIRAEWIDALLYVGPIEFQGPVQSPPTAETTTRIARERV
jgi:hypothetical protein